MHVVCTGCAGMVQDTSAHAAVFKIDRSFAGTVAVATSAVTYGSDIVRCALTAGRCRSGLLTSVSLSL